MFIKNFLNRTSMYMLMGYYLWALIILGIILSALKILPFVWWHLLLTWIILLISSFLSNQILGKIFKVKPNLESQLITADILTLIMGPFNPIEQWPVLLLIAAVSQISKYILVYQKRHIFNPAAFAALFSGLVAAQGASWWVGNQYLLPLILIGGFLILRKLRWFHLPVSFLLTYILLMPVSFALPNIQNLYTVISPLMFFAFVMLMEPMTAPQTRRNRIYYGVFTAIVLLAINHTQFPYGLEASLLIGNLFSFMLNPHRLLVLKLQDKQDVAARTKAFLFEPLKPIKFQAGQFLQWSLPHSKPDQRGIRRWFTIASSPTEERIMLATKLAPEKGSSFKRTLANLNPGDEITATPADGEFILPADQNKKLVFIAGGIGITPFRSMVKNLLDTNQPRDIILLYSVKTPEEIAFKEIWDEAKQKFGLKAVCVVTDKVGFITPDLIKQEVPDWQQRLFYVSGPEPMVEAFEKMLANMGILDDNIKRDYFPGYTETYT